MPHRETVTKAEFARREGTNPKQVRRAIQQGLPVTRDGRIPFAKASAWWRANHRTRIDSPAPNGKIGRAIELYSVSRARKMQRDSRRAKADAERAELELAVRRSELVEVNAVVQRVFEIHRMVRDRILAIPDRLAAQLAAEPDQARVRLALDAELRLALEALSGEIAPGSEGNGETEEIAAH